jgi:hypothetical protein
MDIKDQWTEETAMKVLQHPAVDSNSISTSNVDVNGIPLPPGGEGSGEGGISNESGQWQFHPPPTPPIKGGELSLRYGTLDEEFE